MNILYIETATEKSAIALFDGKRWVYTQLPVGPELSKRLASEVFNLLKSSKMPPEKVCVGKGPGSLTGVRVGRALAKALAFGWEVPLEEFCSMEPFTPEKGPFAVLFDARSSGIYVLTHEGAPELLNSENAKKKVEMIPHLFSPHPENIKKRIGIDCKEAICSFARLDQNGSHPVR